MIFILILLCLAFFIYWLFSPSGASRLWYNIRTFPQRVTSWISDQNFLDYDSYKLNISDVWAKIGWEEDVDSIRNTNENDDVEDKLVVSGNKVDDTIKPSTVQPKPVDNASSKSNKNSKGNTDVPWYSKDDLIWIITKYVENNLDDDTDIIVTIEYEDDEFDPEKIILQTQSKSESDLHFVSIPRLSVKKLFGWLQHARTQTITVVSWDNENVKNEVKKMDNVEKKVETSSTATNDKKTYNGLTQSEIKEAEEIFSIVF